MTDDVKFAGISHELSERSQTGTNAILLVAHFPDVLSRLDEISANHSSTMPVGVVLAKNLTSEIASGLGKEGMLDLIVAERHPLRSVDDDLEQFIRDLPCRSNVCCHLSINDPVIKAFTGSHFKELLRTMGVKEDEANQSPLVTRVEIGV